ncbi:MAG: phosphatidylinositol-3-phosphatase [Pseudonocardiales bacterium]|jgi:hypothetical protein|nr:phosphatidylinositol-3-phosphatase [Pseudonocardiales bacterium]
MFRGLVVALLLVAVWVPGAHGQAGTPPSVPVGHVFTIVLENKDFAKTYGPASAVPFLAKDIRAQGALVTNYFGVAHPSQPNYIAMISGQPPTPSTQADCQSNKVFAGPPEFVQDDIFKGDTCTYPSEVRTLADQLDDAKLTWKGYMEDMGDDPARESATCGAPPENAADPTQRATAKDQYAARHNPFVYFKRLLAAGGDGVSPCQSHVVNLTELANDVKATATTPNFSFIVPDLCSDGHDATCANTQQAGGYAGINEFLRRVVPVIETAPAFKQDGLLIITFDEAEADATACCGNPSGPNVAQAGGSGPGGGRVGAVVVGPAVKPGIFVNTPMSHYGYLRSMEDFFGLTHIGYARPADVATFQSIGLFGAGEPEPPNLFATPPTPAEPVPSSGNPLAGLKVKPRVKKGRLKITVALAAGAKAVVTVKNAGKVFKTRTITQSAVLRLNVGRRSGKFKVRVTATGGDGKVQVGRGVARR